MNSKNPHSGDCQFVTFGTAFFLLWIVTCLGSPQLYAIQDEPTITKSEPAPPRNARVRELQEERLKVCQELVERMDVQFQQGDIPLEAGWKARETLLEAQLDLTETKADRIRIYQELVNGMESWHKTVKKQVESGITKHTDELWFRSQLLKAHIALEKEKALPN